MKLGRYIIGLMSGLTFGLLFAPKKGKDLRKEIFKKGSKDSTEALKALGLAYKEAWNDVYDEIKALKDHEQVEALLELSQNKLHEFLQAAEERGYEFSGTAQEKLEDFANLAKLKAKEFGESAKKKGKKAAKKVSKKVSKAKKKAGKAVKKAAKKG